MPQLLRVSRYSLIGQASLANLIFLLLTEILLWHASFSGLLNVSSTPHLSCTPPSVLFGFYMFPGTPLSLFLWRGSFHPLNSHCVFTKGSRSCLLEFRLWQRVFVCFFFLNFYVAQVEPKYTALSCISLRYPEIINTHQSHQLMVEFYTHSCNACEMYLINIFQPN